MGFALSLAAEEAGYRLAAFETIGSTSTEAMDRALAGDEGPLWIVARSQSAGSGRRGSRWETPEGNLAASLLLTMDAPAATVATLGFVAGIALGLALDECCARSGFEPGASFQLKWPNDVLADGAKLAGILLATEEIGARRRVVTVGIGVNVGSAPAGLPYAATSLRDLGCATGPADLFRALSNTWMAAYAAWDGGLGFDALRELWLARAAGLGQAVAVRTGGGVTRGLFETIDGHGQLVLRASDGSTHRVSAGEVHFGAAASATPEAYA